MADCIIAGGTESMSMVPTAGWKTVPAYSVASETPDYYLGMGLTAEAVAKEYEVTREHQDEFSFHSHQKALNAIQMDISKVAFFQCLLKKFILMKRERDKKEISWWILMKVCVQIHLCKLWQN